MKKLVMMLAAAGACSLMAGETFTWTGAEDAFWTNAANWTVGGAAATRCPGALEVADAEGMYPGVSGDTAIFGAVAEGVATTVDFDGLFSVGAIRFDEGAPAYTLGTDAEQVIPIEGKGSFAVKSGAAMPVFVAAFSPQANAYNDSIGTVTIANETSEPMVFAKFGRILRAPGRTFNDWKSFQVVFNGADSGGFVFTEGSEAPTCSWWFSVKFVGPTTVRFMKSFTNFQTLTSSFASATDKNTYILDEGVDLWPKACNNTCRFEFDNGEHLITGQGRIVFKDNATASSFSNRGVSNISVSGKGRVRIECALDTRFHSGDKVGGEMLWNNGSSADFAKAVLDLAPSANAMTGGIMLNHYGLAIRFADMSALGQVPRIVFGRANAGLLYVGEQPAEVTQTLAVSNGVRSVVRNDGAAALTVSSTVTGWEKSGNVLELDADLAPIVFSGTVQAGDFAPVLRVKGAAGVTFADEATLPEDAAVELAGGTYAVRDDELTTRPLVVKSGANVLRVTSAETVTVPAIEFAGGTLNVDNRAGGTVLIPALAGAVSANLMLNGYPAEVSSEGVVRAVPPAYDLEIAAKGDVVPNVPDKAVAITSVGTGSADTLADDATSVKGLVHLVSADATVAIGAEQALTAAKVTLNSDGGSLTLGDAAGVGTLAGADGLALDNRSYVSSLTVNAKVASGAKDLDVTGPGAVVLAGGTAAESSVKVHDGTLTLADGAFDLAKVVAATNVAVASTLVLDGARVRTTTETGVAGAVGGYWTKWADKSVETVAGHSDALARLVLTNGASWSTVAVTNRSTPSLYGLQTLFVGGVGSGVLEVYDGAALTNRLVVGGDGDDDRNYAYGAVYQRGGEVVTTSAGGNGSYSAGSHVGGRNHQAGYYELAGGRFFSRGPFYIGIYRPSALFRQIGAYACFSNTLSGSSSQGYLGIGATNQGSGQYVVEDGGVCDIYGTMHLANNYSGNATCSFAAVGEGTYVNNYGNTVTALGNTFDANVGRVTVAIADGAKFRTAGFRRNCTYKEPNFTDPSNHIFFVSFDGGTLETGSTGRNIAICGQESHPERVKRYALRGLLVGPNGVTVDTIGNKENYTEVPFSAPTNGVVSALSEFVPFQWNHVTAPTVEISGDGEGAYAYADFDSKTRMVRGVKIVSGGTGFTRATATFYSESSVARSYACEISAPVSGDFTKAGEGDFTFKAENTYGGATVLKGGTLVLGVPNALPANSPIVPRGGLIVSTAANFPAAITVDVTDLDPNGRAVKFARFSDAAPEALPAVSVRGSDDPNWRVRLVGDTLAVGYARGTLLLVR